MAVRGGVVHEQHGLVPGVWTRVVNRHIPSRVVYRGTSQYNLSYRIEALTVNP
jgi:hypothetical protein